MKNRSLKPAVIFDRDGTLIVDKVYLNDPDQIEYLPGVFEGLKQLQDAGYTLVGATNQSGVPRGLVQIENLNEIHRRIIAECSRHGVEFKEFYFAPFGTDTNHFFRKPNPGMLLAAAEDWGLDLKRSWMIGDRWTDMEAGFKAGTRCVLFNCSDAERALTLGQKAWPQPSAICGHFLEVVDTILNVSY